jgi:hypothetical protein
VFVLSYLPMAVVFGLAGYHWRRLPAAARRVIVPAGLAALSAAGLLTAAIMVRAAREPSRGRAPASGRHA